MGCPWEFGGLSLGRPWAVRRPSVDCPLTDRWPANNCPRAVIGLFVGCRPRGVAGLPTGCPREVYGLFVGYASHGIHETNAQQEKIGRSGVPGLLQCWFL